MIRTEGLGKKYGDFTAIASLDLHVRKGEIFGFLGPNGAGKTTTIKILTGLLAPGSGRAFINGYDITQAPLPVKAMTGYLPDEPFLYDYLTPREYLFFLADVRGLCVEDSRIDRLLRENGLTQSADTYCIDLSHGTKKRVALAGALLHEPDLLILDEPTSGLDPIGVRDFVDRLNTLAGAGRTVFLSTHILNIAEKLCDRVGILFRGRLVFVGPPSEAAGRARTDTGLEEAFIHMTRLDGTV